MAASIAALLEELTTGRPAVSDAYRAKQLHAVPAAPVVDRTAFILARAAGQVVLDIGASGPLHDKLKTVAATVYGLDRQAGDGIEAVDLDAYGAPLPAHPDVTLIVCGEVLEHLSNPGWLLDRLRARHSCSMLVTVPNAFSARGLHWLNRDIENVNAEHVAYYSHRTLTVLLARHGWRVRDFAWYHGHPKFAEGLIAVAE